MTPLLAQTVKCLTTMRETRVQSQGWEDPLEKEMATHSSILAWEIPWVEEPGRLQSMGSQRVRHDCDFTHSPALQADSLPAELPGKPSSLFLSNPTLVIYRGETLSCYAQEGTWHQCLVQLYFLISKFKTDSAPEELKKYS